MRLHGKESLKVSRHPAKFGSDRLFGSEVAGLEFIPAISLKKSSTTKIAVRYLCQVM